MMLNQLLPFKKQYAFEFISGEIDITEIKEINYKTINEKRKSFSAKAEGLATIKMEPVGEFETEINSFHGLIDIIKEDEDGNPKEVKISIIDFSTKIEKNKVDEHIMKGFSEVITDEVNKKLK